MKKYLFFILFISMIILTTSIVFSAESTWPITKIALKYQGESSYRIYDISTVNWVLDPTSGTAVYPAISVVTLTDAANSLPSGVITEIKLYLLVALPGWLKVDGALQADPANATNMLQNTTLDLSSTPREKATLRFNGQGSGEIQIRNTLVQDL